MTSTEQLSTGERADLLTTLRQRRAFLRQTVDGLTDAQAAARTTVSELCLGGLIKHLTLVEAQWMRFAVGGADAMGGGSIDWADQFRMTTGGETLAGLLDDYARVAAETDELVSTLDLDATHALPEAPWFPPGASWSVRQVLLHLIGETAQHSGHADILREAIDGAKTMG